MSKSKLKEVEAILDGKPLMKAIRLDQNGEVDDVAIHGDLFRLERMGMDSWWCAIYRGDKQVSFSIYRKGKGIAVGVQEDQLGCKDDSK